MEGGEENNREKRPVEKGNIQRKGGEYMGSKTRKHVLRALPVLLALICVCRVAMAEDEVALPLGVKALVFRNYPGYTVVAADGWGDDARGQYALVLSSGEDNVLVIVEKEEGDPAYAFTVENSSAVLDGEQIPSVHIDTGGDALYYSYHGHASNGYYGVYDSYSFFKGANGVWDLPRLIHCDGYAVDATEITAWLVSVYDGALLYERTIEDENGNIYERHDYAPIPVSAAYEERFELRNFDISMLKLTPEHGIAGEKGLCEGLLDVGDTLIEIDVKENALVLLVERPNGMHRLYVADWNGAQYTVRETGDFTKESALDTYHTGEGYILLYCDYDEGDQCMTFAKQENGDWMLEALVTGDVCFGVSEWSDEDGEYPWSDMFSLDFSSLPRLRQNGEI